MTPAEATPPRQAPSQSPDGLPQARLPLQALRDALVLPVLTLEDEEQAVSLVQCLQASGLGVVEITLRTEKALSVIEAVARAAPSMVLGAGTVRSVGDLRCAADAGASFAVSPGATPALLGARGPIPLIPGVATASEAMVAADAGFKLLKLFPAATCGGPAVLRSWAGPLAELRFVPTGGINGETAVDYLALPNVACVGGSWLVSSSLMASKDWAGLQRSVRSALDALRERLGSKRQAPESG